MEPSFDNVQSFQDADRGFISNGKKQVAKSV